MQPAEESGGALARRLRELRKEQWPGRVVTQGQLAKALGGAKTLSVPLISSWESQHSPQAPPLRHLETYALFFATERSVEREPFRLLDLTELTPAERVNRDRLLDELTALRAATQASAAPTPRAAGTSLWHFPFDQDITIVCAPLPPDIQTDMPYTDPNDPDYVRLNRYADVDALIEVYGYIRALNPHNNVKYRTSDELRPHDYTAHLVLIGGVDWNDTTRDVFLRVQIPVSQSARKYDNDFGAFTVREGGDEVLYEPTLLSNGENHVLVEDIAHFYRGPNPYNQKRTVTFLNGLFSRGTLGAVRALTDTRFRDRNEAYVRERFAGSDTFSVLSRVPVVHGRVVTPDWTVPEIRLHEWPMATIAERPDGR
ncbi:MAG TPA: helix-turn-helix transcriptional regulator [Pseudonocardiaceae bacterium]|jgi:hypothetical protein|nr:helix-turn-helix transcriptional regulator [Pseudonocardiaceae bacterium]